MRNTFTSLPVILLLVTVLHVSSIPFAFSQGRITPTPTIAARAEAPPAGINLTLSPTFINVIADPGKPVASQFKIRNNSNFSENLRIDIAKFQLVNGRPELSPVQTGDAFINWVEFTEREFTVTANQTKTVSFTMNPPQEASLGYYYAFVINRVQEREGGNQGATLTGSPALLTLLEVRSPNAKRELQLVDFKTDKLFYEYLPTTFTIKVKNSGNIHIVPGGNIFIDQQGKEKEVAILLANEARGNVLPQSEREFTASWNDAMILRIPKEEDGNVVKDKKGNTVYTTDFNFDKPLSKFRFGKYTANLLLVYDNGERDIPLEASVSFWVIPWKLIMGALLIVLAPFIIFYTIGRLRRRNRK